MSDALDDLQLATTGQAWGQNLSFKLKSSEFRKQTHTPRPLLRGFVNVMLTFIFSGPL